MEPAGEAEPGLHGAGEADPLQGGDLGSSCERDDEPPLSSSSSVPFDRARESSFRSSSSLLDVDIRSSVGDLELEDDDMMYRLMQSEYEEIPSFRWIASPLRWWKTKRSRRRTHPNRSDASGASGRSGKPEPAAESVVDSIRETRNDLIHFDSHVAYTLKDLLLLEVLAVLNGKGTCGIVYGARFRDGTRVTVKRLPPYAEVVTREDFEAEVNVLGRIRHPNLLALQAYYFSKNEKLLVFDYVPVGSLSAVLHPRSPHTVLDWPTRMNIAMGIARGLHHLHTQENMVHGNLTGGNILLDEQANAKIADYSISNIRVALGSTVIPTAGSFGYRPPKFSMLSRANTKTDVYSFGVIMLEMLTGKSPMEPINGQGLSQWVTSVLEEGRTQELFDRELMWDATLKTGDELLNTLYLALCCVDPSPHARPEMLQVLQQLEDIKQQTVDASSVATAKGGDKHSDEVAGTLATTNTTGKNTSPSSLLDMADERTADPFKDSELGASRTSNILSNEEDTRECVTEDITSSVSTSPSSVAEAKPATMDSYKDNCELTSQGNLKNGENTSTPAPPEEIIQDHSSKEELQLPFESGDVESTASMPSESSRYFSFNLSTSDQPEENGAPSSITFRKTVILYFFIAELMLQTLFFFCFPLPYQDLKPGHTQPIQKAVPDVEVAEDTRPLSVVADHKTGETATTSGVAPTHPLSSINWAEVTLEARIGVPNTPPLITSEPDQGYQCYFQTLYDLAHRSPPLPSTVLAVQLNRMVMGLHSLGYPLDAWLEAATLVLAATEKREYIERHVGDRKVHVEAQLTEFASVIASVREEISRTKSRITTLEQRQDELDETITKLEDQLVVAKARQEEAAGSLVIARDQLEEAEATMESVSANLGRLDRHYSELPSLRNAMLCELPSLDEVFNSNFKERMTTKF